MSDVFWNDLDTYLVNLFNTEMGTGSAYGTLQIQTVNNNIFADAHVYSTWTLPAIAVAGWRVEYDATEHMGTTSKRYRKTYRCMAFGVLSGASTDMATLRSNIKTIFERMETVIRTDNFAVTSSSSEKSRGATIQLADLDITRYPTDDLDSTRRLAIAYFDFRIETSI